MAEKREGGLVFGWSGALTWVFGGEGSGLAEVAVPGVAAGGLVEEVHGVGSVGGNGVGREAGAPGFNGSAVDTLSTGVVQVGLQGRIGYAGFRHAPHPLVPRRWLWCHRRPLLLTRDPNKHHGRSV